ncbi:MAG: non-ribosomal peptide synthetase [Thermoanaerobaculia bacterium]
MSDEIHGFRLSPQQRWLWLLHARGVRDACRARCAVRLRGPLQAMALRTALQRAAARHEALRTVFHRTPGIRIPVQSVREDAAVNWREIEGPWSADLPEPACDLERGPLIDATLFRLDEREHVLALSCSALTADAASFGNLLGDLAELIDHPEKESEEEIVQYLQFSEWQHELLESEDAAEAKQRWQGQGASSRTVLPLEAMTGPSEAAAVHTFELPLPSDTAARIEASGLGVESFLLAAWTVLLTRLGGGSAPPAIALVCDGRKYEPLRASVGPFASALPVQGRFTTATSFAEAVARLDEQVRETVEGQDSFVPEEHWEPMAPVRDWSPGFELLPWPSARAARELELSLADLRGPLAPCRLKLTCIARDGALTIRVESLEGLFPERAFQAFAFRFREIVASALDAPGAPIADLRILGTEEEHELVVTLNDTRAGRAEGANAVHRLFERQADLSPAAVAVEADGARLTYAELNRKANQLAHELRSRGVGPESLIGLYLDRTPEMVIGALGVLKSGAAYLPLDPTYPRERLALIVEDARPSVLLTQETLAASLPAGDVPVLRLDADWSAVAQRSADNLAASAGEDHLAYVIYTSGSTGRPKGVMVPHRSVVNYLSWCAEAYAVAAGQGAPVHSPLGFDLTVTSLFSPLATGRRVRLIPDDGDLSRLAGAIGGGEDYSLVKLTPAHLELLRHNLAAAGAAVGTRTLVLGGEALFGEGLAWWRQVAPEIRLINEYGPTETVVGCCVYEVPAGTLPAGPVPIGRPIANTRLFVLDERSRPVPFGMSGELYIGGEGLARGYLSRPELTAERFVPDPFAPVPGGRLYKTGDVVRYLADGNLEYLGRNDQQVKVRGFRIELGEIESVLAGHPAVREAAVLAREDERGERRLVAYIVTGGSAGVDDLRRFLAERLPDFMIPAHFVPMDAFPLTANGKVDRKALPAPSTERPVLQTNYVAPRTPEESVLAELWSEVLGVDRVGVLDSFFALGGDSIRSVRLVALAKERGFEFTVQQLYQRHRIADLCDLLRTMSPPHGREETAAEDLEGLLAELEGLSDEEVAARLQAASAALSGQESAG